MTRGTENRNPFDLRYSDKIPWMGLDSPPQDDKGYCVFIPYANPMNKDFWGLRAGFRDLFTKWGVDGLRTIRQMVEKFAPPSENPTVNYEKVVCEVTGWGPDDQMDLIPPANLKLLGKGFLRDEQGQIGYNESQLDAAVASAQGKKS